MSVYAVLAIWSDTGRPVYGGVSTDDSAEFFYPSEESVLKSFEPESVVERAAHLFGDDGEPDEMPEEAEDWMDFLISCGPLDARVIWESEVESVEIAKEKITERWNTVASDPGAYRDPSIETEVRET